MPELEISVDRELCASCDICRDTAPNTFEMDGDAKATVKNPEGDPRDVIINAAESCPMNAILVKDAANGEQLVPAP